MTLKIGNDPDSPPHKSSGKDEHMGVSEWLVQVSKQTLALYVQPVKMPVRTLIQEQENERFK